jgi:hypothetical protein
MNTPIPQLDQFDEQRVSPQMEVVLGQRAEMYFRERHPEFVDYAPTAIERLREWCHVQCVPISLRNLEVAYMTLQADLPKDIERVIEAFKQACPDWTNFQSKKNGDALEKWLDDRGLDVTVENLFKAFQYCVKARLIRPTSAAQGIISTKNTIVVRDAVSSADREKFADKPFESDVARKKRDEQLRLAAIRDRVARRKVRE